MISAINYITEALAETPKFKTSKNIPSNIKYAEKVKIRKIDYVIIAIEEQDGYACALYNPDEYNVKYTYISTLENVVKHFDYALNPGKTKQTADIGADGEIHYGTSTIKAAMPKKLMKELVEGKKAVDSFRKISLEPDQIYYLIKNGNKTKGIWQVPYSNYVNKSQTNADSFKICVDGAYYDEKINLRDLMPNPKLGIKKTDKLVVLNELVLKDGATETNKVNHIFYPDVDGVLFIVTSRHFITDGGKFAPCEFVKMDGDTLHLTKLKPVRASVDDARAQVIE